MATARAKRIAQSVAVCAIILLGVGVWGGVFQAAREYWAQQDRIQLGRDCIEWAHKSRQERFLDGPHLAQKCSDYLTSRTEAETNRDGAYWQRLIEDAAKDWRRSP